MRWKASNALAPGFINEMSVYVHAFAAKELLSTLAASRR